MLVMSSAVVPVLVSVTAFVKLLPTCTFPKLKLGGLKLGRGLITTADKPTCCGLPGALSERLSVAESDPALLAKKNTVISQLFPTASVFEQKSAKVKSSLLVPLPGVIDRPLKINGAVPVFFTVTLRVSTVRR